MTAKLTIPLTKYPCSKQEVDFVADFFNQCSIENGEGILLFILIPGKGSYTIIGANFYSAQFCI